MSPVVRTDFRKPELVAVLWTLQRAASARRCELWTHPLGWEIRLLADGELLYSQVISEPGGWQGKADEWRAALEAKGWTAQ